MATSPAERLPRAGHHGAHVCDLAVVGAGPAGVAAAVTAADSGVRTVLLDAGLRPGGQYYRRPPVASGNATDDHSPWPAFDRLETRMAEHVARRTIVVQQDTTAWSAEPVAAGGALLRTRRGDRHPDAPLGQVLAHRLVIATGAHDRQVPFPGWDLPGVMSAGAAQALIKGSRTPPGSSAVVAGTGPFLLAVAATLLQVGVRVVAVVEANDPLRMVGQVGALAGGLGKSGDLARYVRALATARVPYLRRSRVIEAHGRHGLEAVTVARVDRSWAAVPDGHLRHLSCDTLAVGVGFSVNLDLPLQLGCRTRVGPDGSLSVVVDSDQATTVDGVLAAGETTGVAGADLALVEGLIAGSAAAASLGRAPAMDAGMLDRLRRTRTRLTRFADALHTCFPVPAGWVAGLPDDTVVCRCEEVTAGRIRDCVERLGASDARTVKLLSRAGMGWCQGRICGPAVDALGGYPPTPAAQRRPVAVPVRLGALATLAPRSPSPGPRPSPELPGQEASGDRS